MSACEVSTKLYWKFVTLLRCYRQICKIIGNEKIIIPFSKNAGHLSHFAGRGTSDENAGLSRRMRDG